MKGTRKEFAAAAGCTRGPCDACKLADLCCPSPGDPAVITCVDTDRCP